MTELEELREAFDLLVNSAVEDRGPDPEYGPPLHRVLINTGVASSTSLPIPKATYDAIMRVLLRRGG
jgi:hypothetical protein